MASRSATVLLAAGIAALAGCGPSPGALEAVSLAAKKEAESIRDIMLTVAEPDKAVAFFKGKVEAEPANLDHRRGLARSLARGGRSAEAVVVWEQVVGDAAGTDADRVGLLNAHVLASDWRAARAVLGTIPDDHDSFDRHRLEALVADSDRDWARADASYARAVDLTTTPAKVLNNWGYSKLTRGDAPAAETLFIQAITYNETLFTAKNNLMLARASRGEYRVPAIPLDAKERARLLHTSGTTAIRRGDVGVGRVLLEEAIAIHPQRFEAAAEVLAEV